MTRKSIASAALIAVTGSILTLAGAASASAQTYHAGCAAQTALEEFCFYYNSGAKGSIDPVNFDPDNLAASSIPNLQSNTFWFGYSTAPGYGQSVKNNAATAANDTNHIADVFYNSNYGGASFRLLPGDEPYQFGNGLYNQDASLRFSS